MNSFYANHNEIGLGFTYKSTTGYQNYWSEMTAYTNTGSKFLTGVAYTNVVTTDTITATPVGGGASFTTTTLPSGGYSLPVASGTYNVVASDAGFASPVTFSNVTVGSVNVKRDFIPAAALPVVSSMVVNDGTVQRSRVTSLKITFNQAVTLDSDAITLAGRFGAGAGTAVTFNSTDSKVWTVTFGGTPVIGGSLADGLYDLTVVASKVHVGTVTMASNYTAVVKRLFGDIDGDGGVSINDFNSFATSFGKTSGQAGYIAGFDFDGDNGTSINDFNQFATRFGKSLPAATAPSITAAKRSDLRTQR